MMFLHSSRCVGRWEPPKSFGMNASASKTTIETPGYFDIFLFFVLYVIIEYAVACNS
jgi:hypothetical protein